MLIARSSIARWVHLLLILAGIRTHQVACQTAYIVRDLAVSYNAANHSFSRLSTALRSSNYTTLLLTGDCRVSPASYPDDAPIRLSRNVTISSIQSAAANPFILETEYLEQRVIVGLNVTLTLKNIALGRARKSSGQGIPFFAGEGPSSELVLQDVVRVRQACAPNAPELLAVLEATPRAPGANGTQLVALVDFDYKGQTYEDSLHAQDVSSFVSPGDVADTRAYYAGYSLLQFNTTRVCLSYISQACVEQRGADLCVTDAVNSILAAEAAANSPKGTPIAAVVAPVVVVAALLLIGGGVAYWALQRRKRRRAAAAAAAAVKNKDLGDKQQQVQPGSAKANHNSDPSDLTGVRGGAAGSLESLAVGNRGGGWQLLACHTSPEFRDATPNDKIKLGLLLGAGSFGRVYKGVWHNMDVAVKVLQHDSTTAAAISNEVDLVMSFRHPNIVAAYHFVTWAQTGKADNDQQERPARCSFDSDALMAQGSSSAASAITSPGQFAVLPVGHRPKLKSVAECTTSSSKSSFPRPPGVVVGSKDGSTLGSSPAARTASGAVAVSTASSTSSNISAVLAANSTAGNAAYAPTTVVETSSSPRHAAAAAASAAANSGDAYVSGSIGRARLLQHGLQAPRSPHAAALISHLLPSQNAYGTPGSSPLSGPAAAAAASQPSPVQTLLAAADRNCSKTQANTTAGPIAEGTESEAEAAAAMLVQSGSCSAKDPAATAAAPFTLRPQPGAAAAAAAGSGESSVSTGPEWVIKICPPITPHSKLPDSGTRENVQGRQGSGSSTTDGSAGAAAVRADVARQQQQQQNKEDSAAAAAAAAAEGPGFQMQVHLQQQHPSAADGTDPAWPVLSLPAAAARTSSIARTTAGATAAAAATVSHPVARDSMFSPLGPSVRSYQSLHEPQLVRNLPQAQECSSAAAAAAAAAEGVQHSGALQFIPLIPAQLQQQQQQHSAVATNSGSYTTIPMTPAGLASRGDNIQHSRNHHHHQQQQQVVVLQQSADQGSGWRHIGEDLEMDENGNLYSTPGNIAGGGGGGGVIAGSAATLKTADSGRSGGQGRGRRAGLATEAQTWLILEYCDGGTLLDLLQDGRLESTTKEGRKMALVLTLLRDIASGMNYLHSRSVIHGDLKPGNVLIKHEQGAPYGQVAKVSDFGLSRALQVGQSHRSTRTMGTMNHTPPELLRLGRLSPAGDVYAFGIIMWEVFTGKVAFSGLHYGEVFEQVALWQKRPAVPPEMPPDYAGLMMQCWAADPFARPPFSQVHQQLQELLQQLVQDEREAQDRFVSDL